MKTQLLKKIRKYLFFTALVVFSILLTTQFNTKIKTLSLETLKELEGVVYAAKTVSGPSDEACEVEVVVEQNDKETIIHNKDVGCSNNCPETAFVTVRMREKCRDEYGNVISDEIVAFNEPVELRIKEPEKIPKELPFELVDVTGAGYTGSDSWALDWKGLYYASIIKKPDLVNWSALNTTADGWYLVKKSSIPVDLSKGIGVIAVKSWSYKKDNPNIPFEVVILDSSEPEIAGSGEIKVNVDNVDIVRENLQGSNLRDLIPPAGTYYTENPGQFVVLEDPCIEICHRPYTMIKQILADVQKKAVETGEPPVYPPSGNGLDWLQVAATNIYNSDLDSPVFKCVWEVKAAIPPTGGFGLTLWDMPYHIEINPYGSLPPQFPGIIRFNLGPKASKYGFYTKKMRDTIIWHESLHSYQLLPGEYVDDEEDPSKRSSGKTKGKFNDGLFVDKNNAMNSYLVFSYDDKIRGFVNPFASSKPIIKAIEEAKYVGDKGGLAYIHDQLRCYFVSGIELTPEEQKKVFLEGKGIDRLIETPMPKDLPYIKFYPFVSSMWLFLCNSDGSEQPLYPLHHYSYIGLPERRNTITNNQGKKESAYGYYIPQTYFYKFNEGYSYKKGDKKPAPEEILKLLEKGSKLKMLITVYYPHDPDEFDAEYFSNIERGPRTWFP